MQYNDETMKIIEHLHYQRKVITVKLRAAINLNHKTSTAK